MDAVSGASRSVGNNSLNNKPHNQVIILSSHQSQADWDAQYLLALSYLNFDHQLSLALLPNAMETCTWNNKQWQALELYGLEACYHLGSEPPITSTMIDSIELRKLLTKPNQNLLHMCHWKNKKYYEYWLPLAAANDKLLILGTVSDDELTEAFDLWPNEGAFVVITEDQPHIETKANTINEQQWVKLLKQNPVTLTWK